MVENKPSYSVAPSDPARIGVLERGPLLALLTAAILGLVLVFPKESLLQRLKAENQRDSNLTIAYLRNLIRTESQDAELRMTLAEKLGDRGEYSDANESLDQAAILLRNEEQRVRWQKLQFKLVINEFHALRTPGRNATPAELTQSKDRLLAQVASQVQAATSSAQLFSLMQQARDLESPAWVLRALRRVAQLPGLALDHASRGGREALALGEFELSATFYFRGKNATVDSEARRAMLMLGVKALLASGDPKAAYWAAVRESDAMSDGDPFAWEMADLALAAGLPEQAATHVRSIVKPTWSVAQLAALPSARLRQVQDIAFAAGELDFAGRVLQARSTQSPGQTELKEQIAAVQEWAGKPQLALQSWLAIAKQQGSRRAIDEVFRLSPMLNDEDSLAWAWNARHKLEPLSDDDASKMLAVLERLGRPDEALRWLAERQEQLAARAQTDPAIALRVSAKRAGLLWRMGRLNEAIDAYRVLDGKLARLGLGLSREDAVQWADAHLRRGQFVQANTALLRYKAPLPVVAEDLLYWDLLADVAHESGDIATAMRAWEALTQGAERDLQPPKTQIGTTAPPPLAGYQAQRYLIAHIRGRASVPTGSGEAMQSALQTQALAARLYRVRPSDFLIMLWFDSLAANPSKEGLARLLAAPSPADQQRLARNVSFVERHASLLAATDEKQAALLKYRQALSLGAGEATRLNYWWLLVDVADKASLRAELGKLPAELTQIPAFWEVLGATHVLLGEPRTALKYYQRTAKHQPKEKSQDYLWLANYADVLEQSGEAAQSVRVRRHVHLLLNTTVAKLLRRPSRELSPEDAQALIVRARQHSLTTPAEQMWLNQHLAYIAGAERGRPSQAPQADRQEPAGSGPGRYSAQLQRQADSVIFFSALSREQTSQARAWLWSRQRQREDGADYEKLALALAEGDVNALDQLMETSARKFQRLDRHNAFRQLSRDSAALEEAVALSRGGESPTSEELQASMDEISRKHAKRIRLLRVDQSDPRIASRRQGVQVHWPWSENIAFVGQLQLTRFLGVTGANRVAETSLGFQQVKPGLELAAQLQTRGGGGGPSKQGLMLHLSRQLSPDWQVAIKTTLHAPAQDGAVQKLAATQSGLAVEARWQAMPELALQASISQQSLRSLTKQPIGGTKVAQLTAQYSLRRAYPDFVAQMQVQRMLAAPKSLLLDPATSALIESNLGVTSTASSVLGTSRTMLSISVGYGVSQQGDAAPGPSSPYARRFRPYAELGAQWRLSEEGSASGTKAVTPLIKLGARGAVLGNDQLNLGLSVSAQREGGASREWRMDYEYLGK